MKSYHVNNVQSKRNEKLFLSVYCVSSQTCLSFREKKSLLFEQNYRADGIIDDDTVSTRIFDYFKIFTQLQLKRTSFFIDLLICADMKQKFL